jgi:hypothetical protein
MRSQWEGQRRRVHRFERSNGGTRRLGRVTVGLLRSDVVALYGIIGCPRGCCERQEAAERKVRLLGGLAAHMHGELEL